MTWWNPILQDILSTLLTPCTINLIQAWSINPRWLCRVQDNSNEYFHILRTQEQRETGKLVLLCYYVDARAFCSIDRIRQLSCVYACCGRSQLLKWEKKIRPQVNIHVYMLLFLELACLVFPTRKKKNDILMSAGFLWEDSCHAVSFEQWSCEARLFGNDQNVNVNCSNPPPARPVPSRPPPPQHKHN